MTNKPKRRFWQIHLSTAVVLMLASALLLYLNLTEHTRPYTIRWRDAVGTDSEDIMYFDRGFPCTYYSYSPRVSDDKHRVAGPWSTWELIEAKLDFWPRIDEPLLLLNIALALATLTVLTASCEYLIRRKGQGMETAQSPMRVASSRPIGWRTTKMTNEALLSQSLQRHLPDCFLAEGFRLDNCLASSRMVVEVLNAFTIQSRACRGSCRVHELDPKTRTLGKCCARLGASPPAPELHIVAVSNCYLYDLSLSQANDSSNGLTFVPMVFELSPEQFATRRKSYGVADHALLYEFYPDDRAFESLDDWTYQHQRIDSIRREIVSRVRRDLQSA
jgi:hypothetical protein